MTKRLMLLLVAIAAVALFPVFSNAQTSRKSVSGAEVTGTFSHAFTGKFKGSSSDIKILALGKGKLKTAFDLIYPFVDGQGELEANTGQAQGEATIDGDTAQFTPTELG